MTTEIATTDESSIELLPPARQPSLAAREMLLAHAEMMQTAYELAESMCRTKLVPLRFQGKPQDGTAAILYGAELGLNPIQSLQRVVPIHGMPTLEARTMVALLKARGYRFRWIKKSETECSFEGWSPDEQDHEESTWTIEDAQRRGYVPTPAEGVTDPRPDVDDDWVTVTKTWDGKAKKSVVGNMKYITDPKAMLKAKCQAEVCRDLAPEILMGITYSREDLESERFDDRPTPVAATRGAAITVDEILNPPAPSSPELVGYTDRAGAVHNSEEIAKPAEPAEPAAEVPAEPANAGQNRRMHAIFRDIGLGDRQDRLIICGEIIGVSLTSSKDLTTVEASTIINTLESWKSDREYPIDKRLTDVLQAWAARQSDEGDQTAAEAHELEDPAGGA
jgi:hypothetical protein